VDDPKVRQPDIGRANKILGWEPKVEFEDGITRTIDYFRQWLERANQLLRQYNVGTAFVRRKLGAQDLATFSKIGRIGPAHILCSLSLCALFQMTKRWTQKMP
jgi:hypothetical protein